MLVIQLNFKKEICKSNPLFLYPSFFFFFSRAEQFSQRSNRRGKRRLYAREEEKKKLTIEKKGGKVKVAITKASESDKSRKERFSHRRVDGPKKENTYLSEKED